MDYTAGGKLLVDPQKMMNDGYGDTGKMMVHAFGSHWGKLFFSVIYTFYYIALFPIVLKLYDKRK
jgi:hypothetical protein